MDFEMPQRSNPVLANGSKTAQKLLKNDSNTARKWLENSSKWHEIETKKAHIRFCIFDATN